MIILYLFLIYIAGIILAIFSNLFIGIVEAWLHKVSKGQMEISDKFAPNWTFLLSWGYILTIIAYIFIMLLIIFVIMTYTNSFIKCGRKIGGWK